MQTNWGTVIRVLAWSCAQGVISVQAPPPRLAKRLSLGVGRRSARPREEGGEVRAIVVRTAKDIMRMTALSFVSTIGPPSVVNKQLAGRPRIFGRFPVNCAQEHINHLSGSGSDSWRQYQSGDNVVVLTARTRAAPQGTKACRRTNRVLGQAQQVRATPAQPCDPQFGITNQ